MEGYSLANRPVKKTVGQFSVVEMILALAEKTLSALGRDILGRSMSDISLSDLNVCALMLEHSGGMWICASVWMQSWEKSG